MNFETKVRGLMRELMDPVLTKGQKDREMIFQLEKEDQKFEERINLLEMAVYKQDTEGGNTKFDQIDDKIMNVGINLRTI